MGRAAGAAAIALLAASASAQVATSIIPDVGALATGTTVARLGPVTTIDGGTRAGANLFHSFATFDLAAGDTARWVTTLGDPGAIAFVINRVTGGTASHLAGTIDTTALPNAGFVFVNPAGIVFAAGAQVNVPAAAYFATAQSVRFADGTSFVATTATGSAFSVAAPASFGFVGGQADVTVTGASGLVASPTGSLGLYGANVAVANTTVDAQTILLAGIGSGSATAALGDPTAGSPAMTGTVTLDAATLTAHGTADPAIAVVAGSLTLDHGAALLGASTGPRGAGDIVVVSDRITLDHGATIANRDTGSSAGAPPAGSYAAGDLLLTVRLLTLRNGAMLATYSGVGDAGDITLTMPDELGVVLLDSAGAPAAITTTSGPGTGGMISIASPLATISNGGSLLAQGATGGARLFIDSEYFIQSADRVNRISIDGPIVLDANIYDVTNGTAVPDVAFLDAARVLSGQCATARASGDTSRLTSVATGPYARAASAGGRCR